MEGPAAAGPGSRSRDGVVPARPVGIVRNAGPTVRSSVPVTGRVPAAVPEDGTVSDPTARTRDRATGGPVRARKGGTIGGPIARSSVRTTGARAPARAGTNGALEGSSGTTVRAVRDVTVSSAAAPANGASVLATVRAATRGAPAPAARGSAASRTVTGVAPGMTGAVRVMIGGDPAMIGVGRVMSVVPASSRGTGVRVTATGRSRAEAPDARTTRTGGRRGSASSVRSLRRRTTTRCCRTRSRARSWTRTRAAGCGACRRISRAGWRVTS